MGSRLELHTILVALITDIDPSGKVYFQEPESTLMSYPCITYKLNDIVPRYAGNSPYTLVDQYMVTVIDRNPDSLIPKQVALLESARFDRKYVVDNLNHFALRLHF